MNGQSIKWSDLRAHVTQGEAIITPWPEGTFIMSVDSARPAITRGGKLKLIISLLCKAGDRAGCYFLWDLVYVENNPRYFIERLHTMGATSEFLESNPNLAEICAQIVGAREYSVTFKNSELDGRPSISWMESV